MGDYTVEGAQFLCSNPQAFADERRAEQEQWTRERDDFDHGLQNYSVDEAVFFRTNPQAKDIERKLREDSAAQRRTSAQVALLAQSGQLQLPEEYYDDGPRKIMAVVVEPKAPRLRPTDPAVADGGAADDLGFPVGSKVFAGGAPRAWVSERLSSTLAVNSGSHVWWSTLTLAVISGFTSGGQLHQSTLLLQGAFSSSRHPGELLPQRWQPELTAQA